MSVFRLTRKAKADLEEIWRYIAADDPRAANNVEAAIYRDCRLLASNPRLGIRRPDLTHSPLRFWPVQEYPM